jgi:hypothetical protein
MKNLRQEKSLRDHEPSLNRFAVIVERGEPPAGKHLRRIAPFVR